VNLLERVKPVDALLAEANAGDVDLAERHPHALKKTLGVWGLTALGVGAIIGTGIFVLTGKAAALSAGPAIVLSFVVAGVVSALAALCYAELASTVPVAGSAYTYVYATLGEFVAWIVGWGLILEYALGAATVAIGWSGYFTDFLGTLGIVVPKAFSTNPFDGGIRSARWCFTSRGSPSASSCTSRTRAGTASSGSTAPQPSAKSGLSSWRAPASAPIRRCARCL